MSETKEGLSEFGYPRGIGGADYDAMPLLMDSIREAKNVILESYVHSIAHQLYVAAVLKPVGVNDENQPDYEAIAQECVEKAKAVTPPLFRALGLLPKEEI